MSNPFDNLRMLEVEVHSYCNRKCSFCPNSFIDRSTGPTKYLPVRTWWQMLEDLAAANWAGKLTFSRYNEPFADPIFLTRLDEAHHRLPTATLHTNTNGDYLDTGLLWSAYDFGLRSLNIQLYIPEHRPFNTFEAKYVLLGIQHRTSFTFTRVAGNGRWFEWSGTDPRMPELRVRAYARDFSQDGTNRCDLDVRKRSKIRLSPCREPMHSMYIDYNGTVMPCCNMRSDYPPHKDYALGWMSATPGCLAKIWNGKRAITFRQVVGRAGPKPLPCLQCHF